MKKFIGICVIALNLFASCSKDSDPLTLDFKSIQLHHEETKQVKASKDVSKWISENEFVAKVSENGLITGEHVGTTQIIVTDDKEKAICSVEVLPNYQMYIEPFFDFGATRDKIKSTAPYTKLVSDDDIITFEDESCPYKTLVAYGFKNNKCVNIGVIIQHNYSSLFASVMAEFLKERYAVLDYNGTYYTFIDGYTDETIKKVITFEPIVSKMPSTAMVIYSPIETNSVTKCNQNIVENNELKYYFYNKANNYLENKD